jgi:hypothetical protein
MSGLSTAADNADIFGQFWTFLQKCPHRIFRSSHMFRSIFVGVAHVPCVFASLFLIFDKMKAPSADMIVVLGIFSLFSQSVRKVQGAVVTYQAEDADDFRDYTFSTKHTGFQGNGYVDHGAFGSYLSFDIKAPASTGDHEISIRYATKKSRPLDLLVDGRKKHTFPCSTTGDWDNWKTEKTVVSLKRGTRTLKLLASEEGSSGAANIDWLSVESLDADNDPREPPNSPREPSVGGPTSFPESIVLSSNQKLKRGEFVFSPNGKFKVGLTSGGDLVLQDNRSRTIWNAEISGGYRCYMQRDGNVIVRQRDNKPLWTSETHNNPGARLVVSDGGIIAIIHRNTRLWSNGIPRGVHNGPSSRDISFPVRGVFYYPWYPETWTVNGKQARFEPDLGFYSSSDPRVAKAHIDAFEYAHVDLSIASWWGPESNLDRARLTMLMDETIAMRSKVKWTIYYEDERDRRPSARALKEDLDYLKKWFAWHPAWANKNGLPVVFVYNEGGCEVVDRWMDGADGKWYVVMKIFEDYKKCRTQPDHWVSHACVLRSPFLFSMRHSF